jgi:hypothetical protein
MEASQEWKLLGGIECSHQTPQDRSKMQLNPAPSLTKQTFLCPKFFKKKETAVAEVKWGIDHKEERQPPTLNRTPFSGLFQSRIPIWEPAHQPGRLGIRFIRMET